MPAKPVLATKVVSIPELGGEVTVRALMLSEYLEMRRIGDTDPAHVASETLALAVPLSDDNGNKWTAGDWDVFGGQHPAAVNALMEAIAEMRNGAEKKDEAPS
jgi:hypothetical protein